MQEHRRSLHRGPWSLGLETGRWCVITLSFGSLVPSAPAPLLALDRVDLWTLRYLGDTALGYYPRRAYTFATYRCILAGPVNQVIGGTYAELKGRAQAASLRHSFAPTLLVRSGFFLAGLLALIAPELIAILLGDESGCPCCKPFTTDAGLHAADPIKMTVADLFVAAGPGVGVSGAAFATW